MSLDGWLEELRRELIVDAVLGDARSKNGLLLGVTMDWAFNVAIGGGQANFDVPIGTLSPSDRVLLYAYLNQKSHVIELVHAFEKLLADPMSFESGTVIDIGCGPFTAGLALAHVVGRKISYRYVGIDSSREMRAFGERLAREVVSRGHTAPATSMSLHESLADVDFGKGKATEQKLFVLSYLLASESLDVKTLVFDIVATSRRIGLGPTTLIYTNSARADARKNYPLLRQELLAAGFEEKVEEIETFTDTGKPRSIHYALFVKRVPTDISISEFTR